MRLASKFTLVLVLVAAASFATLAVVGARRGIRLETTQVAATQEVLASVLSQAVHNIWKNQGWQQALAFMQEVERRQSGELRWVWLHDEGLAEYVPRIDRPVIRAALEGQQHASFAATNEGEPVSILYHRVPLEGLPDGAVEVTRSTQHVERHIDAVIRDEVVTTLVMVFVFALSASLLGRFIVAVPIQQLVEQARSIGEGDFSAATSVRQRDEIGVLASEMNAMAHRLATAREQASLERHARMKAEEHLLYADRLITVGSLSTSLIHDMATPLNVISGHAGLIGRNELPPEGVRESAGIVQRQTERLTAMIRRILDFARTGSRVQRRTAVAPLVRETVSLLEQLAQKARAELVVGALDDVAVVGDAGELRQVLSNLVINAVQAMPDGGEVHIAASRRNGSVEVSVRDQGTGIHPADQEKIFQPFFTTKGAGIGTGLGLWASHRIILEHGGAIAVESVVGRGSLFRVSLPAAGPAEE